MVLEINKHLITLEPDKFLYMNHLDKYSSEYDKKIARVITSKTNPSLWGLKIKLDNDVKIIDSHGQSRIVSKDGVIPLINNLTIEFNNQTIATIKL